MNPRPFIGAAVACLTWALVPQPPTETAKPGPTLQAGPTLSTATGTVDPVPLPVAGMGDMVAIAYVTPTVDPAASHALADPGGALKPLEVWEVGYLAAVQPEWVTIGRRREIRTDGRVYYCDLCSVPRKNVTTAMLLKGATGATLP